MRACLAMIAVFIVTANPHLKAQEMKKQTLQPYLEPEAYAVYSALLPDEWPLKYARARSLVIQQETLAFGNDGDCIPHGKEFLRTWKTVVDDFKKQNQIPRLLLRAFMTDTPYKLVSKDEILQFFNAKAAGGGWEAFYGRYPDSGGYLDFSAVGFNADRTKAIVVVDHSCGWSCGGGEFSILEKKNNKWGQANVNAQSCAWAS